jgi:hypothetical protein
MHGEEFAAWIFKYQDLDDKDDGSEVAVNK